MHNQISLDDRQRALIRVGPQILKQIKIENSYEDNIKLLVDYFYAHIDDFITCLSYNSFLYLRDAINAKDKQYTLDHNYVFNEDFFFLIELGVLNPNTLKITVPYKKVVKKAILDPEIANKSILNTLMKGILDIYGYVDMNSLVILLNELMPEPLNKTKIFNLYKTSRLINSRAKITRNYILRYELKVGFKDWKKIVDDEYSEFDYQRYSLQEIMAFSSSFSFKEHFPFNDEQNYIFLASKYFSLIVVPEDETFDNLFPDQADLKHFKNYMVHYPKWALKGHTSFEVIHEELFTMDEVIPSA